MRLKYSIPPWGGEREKKLDTHWTRGMKCLHFGSVLNYEVKVTDSIQLDWFTFTERLKCNRSQYTCYLSWQTLLPLKCCSNICQDLLLISVVFVIEVPHQTCFHLFQTTVKAHPSELILPQTLPRCEHGFRACCVYSTTLNWHIPDNKYVFCCCWYKPHVATQTGIYWCMNGTDCKQSHYSLNLNLMWTGQCGWSKHSLTWSNKCKVSANYIKKS